MEYVLYCASKLRYPPDHGSQKTIKRVSMKFDSGHAGSYPILTDIRVEAILQMILLPEQHPSIPPLFNHGSDTVKAYGSQWREMIAKSMEVPFVYRFPSIPSLDTLVQRSPSHDQNLLPLCQTSLMGTLRKVKHMVTLPRLRTPPPTLSGTRIISSSEWQSFVNENIVSPIPRGPLPLPRAW